MVHIWFGLYYLMNDEEANNLDLDYQSIEIVAMVLWSLDTCVQT